ncbi:sulfite exporter TauE/SafE family protein [Sulfitobacter sp.]|uniref:sulfite exporter TauE/SafE family protein n=1 Tax=Sulfitobacter sp. TaxID=1903071 RepID=UPI003002C8A2
MPDILAAALATQGLLWLVLAVCIAGLVRGFAGFGSAMIIMPAASMVLPPVEAIIFMISTELVGPLPNVRAAWRTCTRLDLGRLLVGAVLALPLGIWALSLTDPTLFGWIVSASVFVLLGLMVSGRRLHRALTPRLTLGAGALGGFMVSFAGLPGPPVIMLYMASKLPISVIRANFQLYLLAIDLMLFGVFWLLGMMNWSIVVLGLLVGIPNVIANMVGARLFDPSSERIFRTVAYLVIAVSATVGLPLWKG